MDKVVVLGAGITGISATYYAQIKGYDVNCYEKSTHVGGLISNFEIQGFRFDNAIHLSFSKEPVVKELFNQTESYTHSPNAYCLENGKWLKHPVQNNLYPLETEEKVALIRSFTQRPSKLPEDYSQWLDHQYGDAIAQRYPKKYTLKYWGCEAEKLSTTWIGNRVRRAEIDEILAGAMEPREENHYYANEMRYPKQGGYFEFVRSMAESCPIQVNKEVVIVDVEKKEITFKDGSTAEYDQLINTLPLPSLIPLISPKVPERVLNATKSLLWTTVDLVSIGFNKEKVPPYLWFYIYDEDKVASRGYSPSWKSPNNAPEGHSSLQFEIYNLSTKERLTSKALIENLKTTLLEMNVCEESDILFMDHKHLPFGNVVYDHGMEDRRDIVLDYLDSQNIKSCGRFGEWAYLWSDQSFMSGKNAAESLDEG
ncbi:protoporphyrinogen/coproporphyrinogen oxidase [Alginatibacterium sediminis]|nr:FAD-dependent oxidoreductase [Alginatibacterium sediminis]